MNSPSSSYINHWPIFNLYNTKLYPECVGRNESIFVVLLEAKEKHFRAATRYRFGRHLYYRRQFRWTLKKVFGKKKPITVKWLN